MLSDSTFIATMLAAFIYSTKPGPGYLIEISRFLSHGLRVTISIAAGAYIANFIFIWFGGQIFDLINNFYAVRAIQICSGIYLLYHVFLSLKEAMGKSKSPSQNEALKKRTIVQWVLLGLALNLVSPINITFYSVVLPTYLEIGDKTLLLFYLTCAIFLFDAIARAFYLGLAATIKGSLVNGYLWNKVVITANLVFAMLAIYIIIAPIYSFFFF